MDEIKLCHIVAVAANNVIGLNGELPWHIPGELRWFKAATLDKPVIMGRKTWESLPQKPLTRRKNIVISRQENYEIQGGDLCPNLDKALLLARRYAKETGAGEIGIIGGGELYRQSLPLVQKLYLTKIHIEPKGDAFYPEINIEAWRLIFSEKGPTAKASNEFPQGIHCDFTIYER